MDNYSKKLESVDDFVVSEDKKEHKLKLLESGQPFWYTSEQLSGCQPLLYVYVLRDICRYILIHEFYDTYRVKFLPPSVCAYGSFHSIQTKIIVQEARAAGCRTSAQAKRYIEEKRKKEAKESAHKLKDIAQAGPSDKFLQRASHLKGEPDSSPRGNAQDSSLTNAGQTTSRFIESWDVSGFLGAELLSETVRFLFPFPNTSI